MDAEQIIQTKTTSGIAFGVKVVGVLGDGPITGKTVASEKIETIEEVRHILREHIGMR